MPDSVIISKNGLFRLDWSSKKREYIKRKVKKAHVLMCLRSACEIEEGTTLRDIFNIVDQYKLLKTVISHYAWCHQIDEFHAQAKEPYSYKDENSDEKIDYLEVLWHTDHQQYDDETTFGISTEFHGVGTMAGEPTCFSVSCTPMQDLADLPIKLNKQVKIYSVWKLGKRVKEFPQEMITATNCFSLLEVLDAIYYDISFYGGPAENREFVEEMKETVEGIKNGTVETVPFDLKEFTDD